MFIWIFKLLFRWNGWKVDPNMPDLGKQSVILAAPHTSNWDFIYALATMAILKVPIRFTIKKEWMKWPFKRFMTRFGAVTVDRSPKQPGEKRLSTVEAMANLYQEYEHLAIIVTPEGTRKRSEHWKTGFYYVAKAANVPIVMAYLDYPNKIAGIGNIILPTDDMEADMKYIMSYYNVPEKARFPEYFSIDTRYIEM